MDIHKIGEVKFKNNMFQKIQNGNVVRAYVFTRFPMKHLNNGGGATNYLQKSHSF
jgi:hypothetical protein